MKRIFVVILSVIGLLTGNLHAQIPIGDEIIEIDYSKPKEYIIGGITVTGVQFLDQSVLISLSGLSPGEIITIPGETTTKAIQNLWKQGLFENINISITKIQNDLVFLDIFLEEKPRLSKFAFSGVRKSEADNLRSQINLVRGDVVTENTLNKTRTIISNHYIKKGYLNATANITMTTDTSEVNRVLLNIAVVKGRKVKIKEIEINGNNTLRDDSENKGFRDYLSSMFSSKYEMSDAKAKRALKNTKEKAFFRIFKPSKYIETDFKEDLNKLISKYNEKGYRDATIVTTEVSKIDDRLIKIKIDLQEGQKYYFRNINWVGNTIYTDAELNAILKVQKGEVYNQKILDQHLYMNVDGQDISSLYLDQGYLFFNITPVEVAVENDSIDLEIRIYEGKQALIRKVSISGNTRTNDHVIMREIRSRPGQLFNRSDIIRSQRDLAQLRYFNAEKIGVNPKPNPADGTVDIEYTVEEASADQFELSGGWGLGRVVGTVGLSFNNFSLRQMFKKEAWKPLPSGDGQKISLRAQSNGIYYQGYNFSFTEPWLGGKKPNSFTFSIFHSVQSDGKKSSDPSRVFIKISGVSVGLGKRLQWPDDYFTSYHGISLQNYNLQNYSSTFAFSDGYSNNLNYTWILSRNSVDAPIFPRTGSDISFTAQLTPFYSLLNGKDYTTMTSAEKYRWIEYHKWKINASFFTPLLGGTARKLVLNTRVKYGFLGSYNKDIGLSPFERFYLGGDGLSGFALDGREIIGLRGYTNSALTPYNSKGEVGGTIFGKYTFELRYPLSLNPMATVYVLGFLEAGNAWEKFKEFNPFDVRRSAGIGVRIFLPMFGMLGLDWGYGFDEIPGRIGVNKAQFHFSINNSID